MTDREFREAFAPYRAPAAHTIPKYKLMQAEVLRLAEIIERTVPGSAEKERALRDLQGVRMWANAGIAIWTPSE